MLVKKIYSFYLSFRPPSRNPRGSRVKPGMTAGGLFILASWFTPAIAYAQKSTGIVKCGPQQGTLCKLQDLFDLLIGVYNFLLGMAGIVAFGFLIYGGIQMILYAIDEEHLKAGKSTVIHALVGLAVIALAYIIVNTLLVVLGVTDGAGYFSGAKFRGQ